MAVKAINKITITGNVGGDPTSKIYTDDNGVQTVVTDVSVAVYGGKTGRQDPKNPQYPETFSKFFNCRFRSRISDNGNKSLAEEVADKVKSGMRVTVFGTPSFYVISDKDSAGNQTMRDCKINDNIRMNLEATDIVFVQKESNDYSSNRELPPL